MEPINVDHFKQKLLEERTVLETELSKIAKRDPKNPDNWEPVAPDINPQIADITELADTFEEFENQVGAGARLKERLQNINAALNRIDEGTYGKCEKDGTQIPVARLEANPTAKTCIGHSSR